MTAASAPPVRERIKRKHALVRRWLESGVPLDVMKERRFGSLSWLRAYQDHRNGIFSIPNPNQFTTEHPEYGELIKQMKKDLDRIKERVAAPRSRGTADAREGGPHNLLRLKRMVAELTEDLAAARARYQSERHASTTLEQRLKSEIARSEYYQRLLSEKNTEIANLTRLLSDRPHIVR